MTLPSFTQFYEAVYCGRSPFPWQVRLADEVLERGWSGLLLDLPTGTGKTSVLDVALYCLACAPARMPRRTILVVDRRIVVDQGAWHARALRTAIDDATAGPAHEIGTALRRLSAAQSPADSCFAVAVMRGGMPRDNDWARRPDQPMLGVSTIDQVGSRLLFRGYGISPLSASIHGGLIGNDTLILLDEVHLAVAFAQTLDAIRSRYRTQNKGLPERFAVVQMSATSGRAPSSARRFGLDAADRRHPVLERRLSASKRARLVPVKVTGDDEAIKREAVARRALAEAIALQSAGACVVGVVVNRVDTARLVVRILSEQLAPTTDAILVTGRMRPIDRDRVVSSKLIPRAGASRTRAPDDTPLLVVATQCIEAGADLDFDGLVTECASLDALRQRFGRVDRRGELRETRSIVLGRSDLVADGANDPVYGAAIASTWAWLISQAVDGQLDFGNQALPLAVDGNGDVRTDVLASAVDAAVLLPAHLDAWVQTSITPSPDPDVAMWLHGPDRPAADVQIVWRAMAELPSESSADQDPSMSGDARVATLVEQLAAVRPSALEAVTVPLVAARRWLARRAGPSLADVTAGIDRDVDDRPERRPYPNHKSFVALRWRGDSSELVTADDIRPGDVLVVASSWGGLSDESFDPASKTVVPDLGDLAQLRGRGRPTLRLSESGLASWGLTGDLIADQPSLDEHESMRELAARVREWVGSWPVKAPLAFRGTLDEWSTARAAFASTRSRVTRAGDALILTAPVVKVMATDSSDLITEDDDSSFRAAEITLLQHSIDVRELAEGYARALGFNDSLASDLALAAWLHDVGKADPRFQRWLVGGDEVRAATADTLLAKSALPADNPHQRKLARERAGYPAGYRHEMLSLAMVAGNAAVLARAHDPDLVLHLIASHHGWCRPFGMPMDDPADLPVALSHGSDELAATTRHRLARLDSGIVDRFWSLTEHYGWWGLAWLEAVLRLADHRASEAAEWAR